MNKDYLYLETGYVLGRDVNNKVLRTILKPKKHDIYWYDVYIKDNFPKVDFIVYNKPSDAFLDVNEIIDKKANHVFDRKRKRRLNFQEIKYLYVLELIKNQIEGGEDKTGLLYQLIYPHKYYQSNCSATGIDWLFKTLGNKKEHKKIVAVWTCKKDFAGTYNKYLQYFFKKMIRKVKVINKIEVK